MSDQQPPAGPDTAAVAGPEQAPGTAQEQPQGDPYEKRYNDLRPQFDRTAAERNQLAERQQWYEIALTTEDEDTRRQALEQLGYELPDEVAEEPEPVYEDPYEELAARQERVEAQLQERTQGETEAEQAQLIRELTDERLAALEGLAEEDQDLVLAYAVNALAPIYEPGVPVPLPDVEGAFKYFQDRETARQKAWAEGKRRAPYVSDGGQEANEAPLPPNAGHDERVQFALQKMQEREAMQ